MSESCNSRHFSWLMKSCFPNQNHKSLIVTPQQLNPTVSLTLSSLPDDLLLECLSRVPSSSLPSLSLVCRRWFYLILSPSFLLLRHQLRLLSPSIFAFSATDSGIFAATLSFSLPKHCHAATWDLPLCLPMNTASLHSISRLVSIGPRIYMIGRNFMLRYNAWTQHVTAKSPMLFSRKKYAAAVVSNKIYVAGGVGSRIASAVEEYDPENDTWRVVSYSQRRRYGCIGAAVDGVFYVIGGLKIGGACGDGVGRIEAHVYASSMDLYDVEARVWLRSRAVPGGGCVVAACAVAGYVYVLTSHAVELSFWRFDARRKCGGGEGFGEWCRMKSPPMPTQIRLDGTVRFCCVGVGDNKVILVQVVGCIDDLLRRGGRSERGFKDGLVLVYDSAGGEWSRAPDLPEVIRRAACVSVEC
ncbi:F-box/kelch-repeat protein [Hibiscus syriacus]|uniref:F-box/kelch-repeat protein n=1 Tax=Hibiscus syriacus TaxID=106335 RepID=A0A6A2WRP4_HIBSY|nr:F-box/kelch-repeat protein At5g26960-like [Hibiscus syriacus]KAE8662951.1 F-box/kelch-repeat protein [Hibiscus syriacus]